VTGVAAAHSGAVGINMYVYSARCASIFSATVCTPGPLTVLIRTFRTDENLADPDANQTIFEACDRAGIAPRMYAVDRGGLGVRAEEFIEGTTMSLSQQLRSLDIELRAAPMIAQLHSVKV